MPTETDETRQRREAFELIPWYVTGTLDADDRRLVEGQMEVCAEIRREVREQTRLAGEVAALTLSEEAESRSWQRLAARVAADGPQPAGALPPVAAPRSTARRPRRALARASTAMALAGAAMAAALALALLVPGGGEAPAPTSPGDPTGGGYTTLTTGSAAVIKLRARAGTDPEAIRSLALSHGARVISGPSEAGVYDLALPEGADREAVAAALRAAPAVLFVSDRRAP